MQANDALLAQLSAVRKCYGKVPALDGVDLDLRGGEVLALLGANGAGKSTAIGLLPGLLATESAACSSRWRCAGGRSCCSSTNPPPAWTSRCRA